MRGVRLLFVCHVLTWTLCAVEPAGAANQETQIEALIQQLGQRDWRNAAQTLTKIGEPGLDPLVRTLRDPQIKPWVIQARIIEVLKEMGTPAAVGAVCASLQDQETDAYVRGAAALALADLKQESSAEMLAVSLQAESQFVRWKSAQALGLLGQEKGADALIRGLKDSDQYVRAAAANSLGQIRAPQAAQGLIEALEDEHWSVRRNARAALLKIGQAAATDLIDSLEHRNPEIRWQAAWVLGQMRSEAAVPALTSSQKDPAWMVRDEATLALDRIKADSRTQSSTASMKRDRSMGSQASPKPVEKIHYMGKTYPCYPKTLPNKPDLPSPFTTEDGAEMVVALTKDGAYTLIPVTVENGKPLNYAQRQWGKGRQLDVAAEDFPSLASTGLHIHAELEQTKVITGRSIVEMTELGRPGRSSGAGFMAQDEDVLSVLRGDNGLVRQLGLTHAQMARPLFHVWNMMLLDIELKRMGRFWDHVAYLQYNGVQVHLKGQGTRGWQESLFDDEILGMYQFEVWRELTPKENALLNQSYAHLNDTEMAELVKRLSHLHTGEMVPYYIMRYGFYEGHTEYRADPIAIAWIFGLRDLEEIEAAFPGKLYHVLTQHFTRE